jgi:hypothetical protein
VSTQGLIVSGRQEALRNGRAPPLISLKFSNALIEYFWFRQSRLVHFSVNFDPMAVPRVTKRNAARSIAALSIQLEILLLISET